MIEIIEMYPHIETESVLADLYIGDATVGRSGTERSFSIDDVSYIASGELVDDGLFLFDISAFTETGADYGTRSYKLAIFNDEKSAEAFSLNPEIIMLFIDILKERYSQIKLKSFRGGWALPTLTSNGQRIFIWISQNYDYMLITRKKIKRKEGDPFDI